MDFLCWVTQVGIVNNQLIPGCFSGRQSNRNFQVTAHFECKLVPRWVDTHQSMHLVWCWLLTFSIQNHINVYVVCQSRSRLHTHACEELGSVTVDFTSPRRLQHTAGRSEIYCKWNNNIQTNCDGCQNKYLQGLQLRAREPAKCARSQPTECVSWMWMRMIERKREREREHERECKLKHEHEGENPDCRILGHKLILYTRVNMNVNVNCMATLGFCSLRRLNVSY